MTMPSHDPSTKHVLEGRELIDYLIEKTAGATNAQMLQREERRNRRTAVFLSILAFVGIGAIISAIKLFVQQEMAAAQVAATNAVRESLGKEFNDRLGVVQEAIHKEAVTQVTSQIGQIQQQLKHDADYRELLFLSDKLEREVNEKSSNAAELVSMLHKAVARVMALADAESIRTESRFVESLNVVVNLLARSDMNREINRLDKALGDVMAMHQRMALNLTDHYGQFIISSPHPVSKLTQEADALARYARASRDLEYPEKAMMWELFVAYKENSFQATYSTRAMVDQIHDLSELDRSSFCRYLLMYQDPRHWMHVPDHEGREMGRLVNGLLEQHSELQKLMQNQVANNPKLQLLVRQLAAHRARAESVAARELPADASAAADEAPPPPRSEAPTAVADAALAIPTLEEPARQEPTLAEPPVAPANGEGNAEENDQGNQQGNALRR